MEFVSARRQASDTKRVEVNGDATYSLNSVRMNRNPAAHCETRKLLDRLNRAGLVVGEHERCQGCPLHKA